MGDAVDIGCSLAASKAGFESLFGPRAICSEQLGSAYSCLRRPDDFGKVFVALGGIWIKAIIEPLAEGIITGRPLP